MTWQKMRKNVKLVGRFADLKPASEDDAARGYQRSASQASHGGHGENSNDGHGGSDAGKDQDIVRGYQPSATQTSHGGDGENSNDGHGGSDAANDQDTPKSDGGSSDSKADWALFSEKLKERCGLDVSAEALNIVANDCRAFYMEQLRSSEDVPGIEDVPETETFSFALYLQNALADKALTKVNKKSELMKHAKDCLQTFVPQYLKPFLEYLPLEGELQLPILKLCGQMARSSRLVCRGFRTKPGHVCARSLSCAS